MSEDKTNFGYERDKEILVTGIYIETMPKNVTDIRRIRISSDVGEITWRPKKKETRYIDGFAVETMREMTLDDIPRILRDIALAVQQKGSCRVKAEYGTITRENDEGELQEYKFVNSENVINRWAIVENNPEQSVFSEEKI